MGNKQSGELSSKATDAQAKANWINTEYNEYMDSSNSRYQQAALAVQINKELDDFQKKYGVYPNIVDPETHKGRRMQPITGISDPHDKGDSDPSNPASGDSDTWGNTAPAPDPQPTPEEPPAPDDGSGINWEYVGIAGAVVVGVGLLAVALS